MTVVISGDTGITTPAQAVAGNLSYTGTLTGNGGIVNIGSGQIYKDASGNVGFGTSSPFSTAANRISLSVNGTTDSIIAVGAAGTRAGYIYGSATQCNIGAQNFLVFETNNGNERARIDSSGNFLFAKTVTGLTTVGTLIGTDGLVRTSMAATTSGTTCYELYSTGASAYRFYVDMGGTIHATSIVITAISDQRLKENVRDIDTGLNAVMALKPRRFDWKEGKGQDKKNAAGFIAQEFETVFPECVSTSKAGEDGIEYKNINHETLIPTLVKAIQELKAIVDTQAAKIAALENK